MPKIRYTGGSPIRLIEVPGTPGKRVAPGDTIEVSQEIHDTLLQRPTRWKAVVSASKKKSTDKPVTGKE